MHYILFIIGVLLMALQDMFECIWISDWQCAWTYREWEIPKLPVAVYAVMSYLMALFVLTTECLWEYEVDKRREWRKLRKRIRPNLDDMPIFDL